MDYKKLEILRKVSDPEKVMAKGKKYGFEVVPSSRKDKKYMVIHEGKKIHFGAINMEDWTKHDDEIRRERFKIRNVRWKDQPKWTPGWLSYHLLW